VSRLVGLVEGGEVDPRFACDTGGTAVACRPGERPPHWLAGWTRTAVTPGV